MSSADKAKGAARDAAAGAKDVARSASGNPVLEGLARAGYATSGLLHLLIAWIALRVAFGGGDEGNADQSGALATLASTPFGVFLLWAMVAGLAGLAIWQVVTALVPTGGDDDVKDRAKAAAKAVMYAALAVSAATFALGGGSSSDSQQSTQDFTQTLMRQPAGQWLVILVGLAVVAAGAAHAWKGATRGFRDDLTKDPGAWATWSGTVGYVAKGVALAIMGGLFVVAAVKQESEEASGLDGALMTLREQPLGTALLAAVAVGLAAFGVYCFARARYARL